MSTHDVRFGGSGIPETVLPAEDPTILAAISDAQALPEVDRRAALITTVSRMPKSLFAWAALGDTGRDVIESYSAYRVGYHRGLDALRHNGWRGSGYVRWSHPQNRGFLRCLAGLQRCATEIGETDEAERCDLFLRQLEPGWPPSDLP